MPSIARPLDYIFNKSSETGLIPDILKLARTCQIFKSGKHELLTNCIIYIYTYIMPANPGLLKSIWSKIKKSLELMAYLWNGSIIT